jgi:hypothetical protein
MPYGARPAISGFALRVARLATATGEGTRLTNAMDLHPEACSVSLPPLAPSTVRTAVAQNLDKLKEIVERRGV